MAGTNASVRQLSPNVYAIGLVRLNKQARTITFPGSVNMTTGLVEYAVVHVTGKVHESVLKTETDPYHIHLANLLLASAQGPGPAAGTNLPPDLTGAPVQLAVRWKLAGAETNAPLEELIINTLTGTRMTRGDWIYNGSRLVEGVFLAQRDGQIVPVRIIPTRTPLINNPRPGREDDEIWRSNRGWCRPWGHTRGDRVAVAGATEVGGRARFGGRGQNLDRMRPPPCPRRPGSALDPGRPAFGKRAHLLQRCHGGVSGEGGEESAMSPAKP
ncbi:MAG: YdjY domain-containing protein [Verrucomicrobiota bacterium]